MTMANYKTRVSLLAISLVFALTAFAPIIASAEQRHNPPKPSFLFKIEKVWAGDKIDTTNVNVVFTVTDKKGSKEITSPDYAPISVWPGQELSLSEEVTGLPSNCTYTSSLPESYVVFQKQDDEFSRNSNYNQPEPKVDILPVTNTVTCEDEGEVLGTTTATTTPTTTVASLPNTGSKVAAVAAILTAITTGAVMFSTTLRSALVKFTN